MPFSRGHSIYMRSAFKKRYRPRCSAIGKGLRCILHRKSSCEMVHAMVPKKKYKHMNTSVYACMSMYMCMYMWKN